MSDLKSSTNELTEWLSRQGSYGKRIAEVIRGKDEQIIEWRKASANQCKRVDEQADEIERLTAENERLEKEAACAAHNADKYHDIIREQRAKVERLEAVVEAVKDIKWRSIEKDNMEFATTCFVVDRIREALAALQEDKNAKT